MTANAETSLPLSNVRVVDLSTLLPGPMASLMLTEAGAEVIKIERPGTGDEMRTYEPKFGPSSANFALLNRGKTAVAADLKDPTDRDQVMELIRDADVVIEQFRPGVVERLGLGYEDVVAVNPGIIYCSITGYGPEGPMASKAGHDLNYVAESGLLGVVTDENDNPGLPFSVIADIAGGTYPAVMNILMALLQRDKTGTGSHIHVSMVHSLQVMAYGYMAAYHAGAGWPKPAQEQLTGGSPRYNVYRTADGRHVAVAALEEKFWHRLVQLIGLSPEYIDDTGQEAAVIAELAEIFDTQTAAHWRKVFDGEDICTTVVNTFDEAMDMDIMNAPTDHTVAHGDQEMPALQVPIASSLRTAASKQPYPLLEGLADNVGWSAKSC